MEATDTVMSDKELETDIRKDYEHFTIKEQTPEIKDVLHWTREAQAEISFKAGYKKAKVEFNPDYKMAQELSRFIGNLSTLWIDDNRLEIGAGNYLKLKTMARELKEKAKEANSGKVLKTMNIGINL